MWLQIGGAEVGTLLEGEKISLQNIDKHYPGRTVKEQL